MPTKPNSTKSQTTYIGIDPGKQGGICLLVSEQTKVVNVEYYTMPPTPIDLWTLVEKLKSKPTPHATIEHVSSMPGEGHKGAFTFGRGVGQLEMAFAAARIPLEVVTPRKWQGHFSIQGRQKGEAKKFLKERCRAKSQSLYPYLDVWKGTLGFQRAICDALLIATYTMRIRGNAKTDGVCALL